MEKIRLNNIRVYAYHGCLKEEEKIGSDYLVNLTVYGYLEKSAYSDKLEHTIDYVSLNKIVKKEMAKRSKLLEHVAQRILDRIFEEEEEVIKADVEVSKLNPPLGGDVESVTICLSKER
ncbi:dihydroneopterin aldolase [Haloflavibacter putidus]|uniref:7,8-dihydroneopterin aldolase n=1 Tax=Haloflavibacter putidus TaxID=2576776 RepID=A0A507ZVU2_9FLAO|nr:dihydroneopterin aldolase [Haloflavibacter putidus]TQD40721.1 dihydroneopterin aldolase [Haloflavibacter putidus]